MERDNLLYLLHFGGYFKGIAGKVLEETYAQSRKDVLPYQRRDSGHGQLIEDERHQNSSEIVLDYLKKTKGRHNLHLLRDAGKFLLRAQKNQECIGTSSQQPVIFSMGDH